MSKPSRSSDGPSNEKGDRRQIYLPKPTTALLERVATTHHGGNVSAAVTAAVPAYLAYLKLRRETLRQAILDLWQATAPSNQVDQEDDTRAQEPHRALVALLDEEDARAIGEALAKIRTELLEQGIV